MIWLTKWLREYNPNARVLIITDCEELDEQIEKVYKGVQEDIYRTKSEKDLLNKLNVEGRTSRHNGLGGTRMFGMDKKWYR